jgi:serine/threonine protein kinase
MNIKVGDSIGSNRYEIIEKLGEGGFGVIFLAKDRSCFNKLCVVKYFIYKSLGNNQEARELFTEEARILLAFEKYSQIPNLFAYLEEENCLVEEFIPGKTLEKELEKQCQFSEEEILDLLDEMLTVLEFVHKEGIVHMDIKPSNIIRSELNNRLVLLDFGISKNLSTTDSKLDGTKINNSYSFPGGTPGFKAPDSPSSFSSDLYSLGATCVQLLTGDSPEDLKDNWGDEWIDKWQWRLDNVSSVSNAIQFINKLLGSNNMPRFQSAIEALQELETIEYIKRKKDIETSTSLLSSSVSPYKSLAITSLAKHGQDAQRAIPQLIELIKSQDNESIVARNTLIQMGLAAVIPLANLLRDESAVVRRNASLALWQIGSEASAATPQIIDALEDSDHEVRLYIIKIIGKIGLPAKDAIPSLIKIIKEENSIRVDPFPLSELGTNAVLALETMGVEAQSAIPVILEILRDIKGSFHTLSLLSALEEIGYDINTINFYYINDGITRNGNEHLFFQREARLNLELEAQRVGANIISLPHHPISVSI